jgi:hypothetical protein
MIARNHHGMLMSGEAYPSSTPAERRQVPANPGGSKHETASSHEEIQRLLLFLEIDAPFPSCLEGIDSFAFRDRCD